MTRASRTVPAFDFVSRLVNLRLTSEQTAGLVRDRSIPMIGEGLPIAMFGNSLAWAGMWIVSIMVAFAPSTPGASAERLMLSLYGGIAVVAMAAAAGGMMSRGLRSSRLSRRLKTLGWHYWQAMALLMLTTLGSLLQGWLIHPWVGMVCLFLWLIFLMLGRMHVIGWLRLICGMQRAAAAERIDRLSPLFMGLAGGGAFLPLTQGQEPAHVMLCIVSLISFMGGLCLPGLWAAGALHHAAGDAAAGKECL